MRSQKLILVSIIFVLLTIAFTFPLVLKINSSICGFNSTDEPFAALWNFWWAKYAHVHNLDSVDCKVIAAPFGIQIEHGYFLWGSINKLLALATNPPFTYNIQALFSFILTGLTTYVLAFHVLENIPAALFTAVIFAFCPYHFVRSWQHLGLAYIQWIPLYIYSLLLLYEKRTLRAAILAGLAFALVMAFDLYYAYFVSIITLVLICYAAWRAHKPKEASELIKLLLISAIVALLLGAYDIFKVVKSIHGLAAANAAQGAYGYIRPFEDLFAQSARPLSYFLPAPDHPVFGKFTEQFIGSGIYGTSYTEHVLYLGWVPLILAFLAVRRWWKDRRRDFYIGFFLLTALVAWIFSQPPWWNIFGLKLYMPSFFIYKIAPMFRAYCRFGIIVMLGVAVLAGFGFKAILEKFKSQWGKMAIAVIFSGLACFEFWNYPPFKVIDVSRVPEAYYWLGSQPGDFTIAEYPLDTNGADVMYEFYQTVHEKKIINGTMPGTQANKITRTLTKLSSPQTTQALKQMGIKYIFVHKDGYLGTELVEDKEELSAIPQNKDLKYLRSFPGQDCPGQTACSQKTGPIDVYELIPA